MNRKRKVHSPLLVNATEMARVHPTTFEAPSKRQLRGIRPKGIRLKDLVKISNHGERFWVEIVERDGDLPVRRFRLPLFRPAGFFGI
jgi:hypothetical protein